VAAICSDPKGKLLDLRGRAIDAERVGTTAVGANNGWSRKEGKE